MSSILILDNYDSFTYNLVHAVHEITGEDPDVIRNDALTIEQVDKYEHIIFSPGPGIPEEAGLLKEIIKTYIGSKKMLGVCLGHQAIFEVLGGSLKNLTKVYHGIQSDIIITEESCPILQNLDTNFKGGRYHSWVGELETLPESLSITCKDEDGYIMGFQHKELPVFGVQFHPESILTPDGNTILKNFLNI